MLEADPAVHWGFVFEREAKFFKVISKHINSKKKNTYFLIIMNKKCMNVLVFLV